MHRSGREREVLLQMALEGTADFRDPQNKGDDEAMADFVTGLSHRGQKRPVPR